MIEIGEERIHLLEKPEEAAGRFATLTWRWGNIDSILSLRQGTSSRLAAGIYFHELPRLFQDVVSVTQGLGIRYLWIDALCIDQDDTADLDRELQEMPAYYTNADFNIVAGVKYGQTKVLCARLPPRIQPTCLDGNEDVFIGWLGTDAYNDPRGLEVSLFPDAWKYESPPHLRAWSMQEVRLARRNLVLQSDGDLPQDPETVCTRLTSQLYMQCQEEIRWENGRRSSGITNSSPSWYDLVEEYSGRNITFLKDRIPAFCQIAFRYSRTSGHRCGEYLAGLWSDDLLRGLLWRAEENELSPRQCSAPSWSWAAVPGRVKHVWPLDATPLASIQGHSGVPITNIVDQDFEVADGYIMVRSLLVEMKSVERTWSSRTGDIKVDVLHENEHKGALMIRYTLDNVDPETTQEAKLYGNRITRRIGLLLVDSGKGNDSMKRVGLFIVAKPDTLRWTAITGEREVKLI